MTITSVVLINIIMIIIINDHHHHHLRLLQFALEVTELSRAEVGSARVHLDWRVAKPEIHFVLPTSNGV